MFFAQGGEKEVIQKLTGNKQFEEKTLELQNANVEKDEWIKDSEGLREVEGKKHSEGGVFVHLEDGAKVLSDKGQLGKEFAKSLSEEFDLKFKKDTTYAEALNKIQNKIGLGKVVEEQEKIISRIDYQQKNVKDENTLSANIEVLSSKLKDAEDRKKPLEEKSEEVFDRLFEHQESQKKDKENTTGVFADGGKQPSNRIANKFENWEYYKHQNEIPSVGSGIFGKEIDKVGASQDIQRVFPSLYSKYFKEGSNLPTNVKEFQQDTQRHYYNMLDSAKNLYGEESEDYKQLEEQLKQDGFTDGSVKTDVRSFDNKFGNFTSTRPNYSLKLLPEDVHKKVTEAGVNTVGELKTKFPEEYETYINTLGFTIPEDAWLGKKNVEVPTTTETEGVVEDITKNTEANKPIEREEMQSRMGVANLPDQTPLIPTGMASHLKTNRRYERLDFKDISPEQQLAELNKATERAENNLDMMPPQQKASLSANLLATQADQTNKILSQTNQFNTQGQQQIDNQNAQIQAREADASASDALNYEQRQLLAEAKTQADYNQFYNTLQRNDLLNYNVVNDLNLSNQLYDDFQFTDRGIESKGHPTQFKKPKDYKTQYDKQFEYDVRRKMEKDAYDKSVAEEAKRRQTNK